MATTTVKEEGKEEELATEAGAFFEKGCKVSADQAQRQRNQEIEINKSLNHITGRPSTHPDKRINVVGLEETDEITNRGYILSTKGVINTKRFS